MLQRRTFLAAAIAAFCPPIHPAPLASYSWVHIDDYRELLQRVSLEPGLHLYHAEIGQFDSVRFIVSPLLADEA